VNVSWPTGSVWLGMKTLVEVEFVDDPPPLEDDGALVACGDMV